MIKQRLQVQNKLGLHARAAGALVDLTNTFCSQIELHFDGKAVNGKRIMSVMLLAAAQGSTLDLVVTGDDEQAAAAAITALFDNRFGEGE